MQRCCETPCNGPSSRLKCSPEPQMLKEMAAEVVASKAGGQIAGGHPGPTQDEGMPTIIAGCREIIIEVVDLRPGEGGEMIFGPFPDISVGVMETRSRRREHVNGRRTSKAAQEAVIGLLLPWAFVRGLNKGCTHRRLRLPGASSCMMTSTFAASSYPAPFFSGKRSLRPAAGPTARAWLASFSFDSPSAFTPS